ncbi:MAG: hypothetical protein RR595_06090 [Lysinibacillus sp.]
MSILIAILPIVIFITSIFFFQKKFKISKKLWTPKRIYIVVGIYLIIGLSAMIYSTVNIDKEIAPLSKDELIALNKQLVEISKYEQMDDSSYLDDQYIKERWSYKITENQLDIALSADYDQSFDIRIRYNENQSPNTFSISYYQFPLIKRGVDYGKEVASPTLSYSDNQLTIEQPPITYINRYYFTPSIMVLRDVISLDDDFQTHFLKNGLLLIDAPTSLNLNDPTGYILFIQ